MKKMTIILTHACLALLIFSCGNESDNADDQVSEISDTLAEIDMDETAETLKEVVPVEYDQARLKVCIDSIWNCQKVAEKNDEWRESSDGKMGFSMMQIDGEDEIYLDFGENNEVRFVNYWNFIVEPNADYRISFFDIVADEYIDFGEWCQK